MKRSLSLLLAVLFMLTAPSPGRTEAATPITLRIDGQAQTLVQEPLVVEGTLFLPLQEIFKKVGAKVTWDPKSLTATATRGTHSAQVTVGQKGALVDGRTVELVKPARQVAGQVMVPLQLAAEALGSDLIWNSKSRSLDITTHVGGAITLAVDDEPSYLLPGPEVNRALANLLYDGLLQLDEKGLPVPALAASYTVEHDRIYTFTLRDDVTWHDGTPLTAYDVLFTYQMKASPFALEDPSSLRPVKGVGELVRYYASRPGSAQAKRAWEEWAKGGGFRVLDERTFVMELEKPYSEIVNTVANTPIQPARRLGHYLGAVSLKSVPTAMAPIGTGRYRFVKWEKGQYILLERNPKWAWGVSGQRPRIQQIKVVFTRTPVDLLKTGAVDAALLSPVHSARFTPTPDTQVRRHLIDAYTYIGYNQQDPILGDVRVRQAITHAIDRSQLVKEVLNGNAVIAHTTGIPGRWDYAPDAPIFEFDPAKAAALLDQAGWKLNEAGLREKNGKPLVFELVTNAGVEIREQTARFVQQSLRKVGINVKVTLMEWNDYQQYLASDRRQAYVASWILGGPDLFGIFHSSSAWPQQRGYKDRRVDALLEEARSTTDLRKLTATYQEVQRILAADQVYTWLHHSPHITVANRRIKGMDTDRPVLGKLDYQLERWYVVD